MILEYWRKKTYRYKTKINHFEIDYVSDCELSENQIRQIEEAISLYLEPNLKFVFNRKNSLERTNRGKLKQFKSML